MAEAEDGSDFGGGGGEEDGLGHGAEICQGVGVVGVECVGRGDGGAGAGDGAEFGEEGGVHVRLGERILRRGKDGGLGAMGGFVVLQSIGRRPQSSRKILRMTRLMRGYRFSKALSRPKKAVHFFKNAPYIF